MLPYKLQGKQKRKYNIRRRDIIEKKKGNVYRELSMYLIKKYTDLKLSR